MRLRGALGATVAAAVHVGQRAKQMPAARGEGEE